MKTIMNNLVHKVLWALTEIFENRVKDIYLDGKPYLRRFYLLNKRNDNEDRLFGLYLHYFYMGDEDRELHNHPWERSHSLILTGGYDEERKTENNEVATRTLTAGCVNVIDAQDFHRIILNKKCGNHTWTLFLSGKRTKPTETGEKDWGFWDRENDVYIPHEKFLNKNK